jgi:hypothetical protein
MDGKIRPSYREAHRSDENPRNKRDWALALEHHTEKMAHDKKKKTQRRPCNISPGFQLL